MAEINNSQGISVQEHIAKIEANPKRAAALQRARERLGRTMINKNNNKANLVALRLSTGLSQIHLANKLGVQQADVHFMEHTGNIDAQLMKDLAEILNVSETQIIEAAQISMSSYRHGVMAANPPSVEVINAALYLNWSWKACGFGQLSIGYDRKTGEFSCSNEGMSRERVRTILHSLADHLADSVKLDS
jgi:transcriptional regulator with XRE-family HTH domain